MEGVRLSNSPSSILSVDVGEGRSLNLNCNLCGLLLVGLGILLSIAIEKGVAQYLGAGVLTAGMALLVLTSYTPRPKS